MKWVIKYTLPGGVTNEHSVFSIEDLHKWLDDNVGNYSLIQIVRNGVSDRIPS